MAIFRGVGGSGDSSDNSFLQEVTAQANAASASASAASASAILAQASANSILTLTAATGDAGTDVSYNASTGVLTVPRGADGTDASVTAANVTGVLTGGTGISIASNGTITNDSPDQIVALTGTGATTVTGTYPNFTIDSTNTTYTVGDGGLTTNDFTDADHTKLDGIEANATADQTGAEIKSAYEAVADTNAFTDAEKTKLSGIEASADVTDTVNVTAAGALMDSEVTNLAQVKAFDSSDYATAAQGTTADNALPKAGGQMTGNITFSGTQTVDGRDVSVDGTKLDTIPYHRATYLKLRYNTLILNLNTVHQDIGQYTSIYSLATPVKCSRYLDFQTEVEWKYISSTNNDLKFKLQFSVPTNNATVTTLGTATAGPFTGYSTGQYEGWFYVSGDVTHLLTAFGRMNKTGTSNSLELIARGWQYVQGLDRTYILADNNPAVSISTGDTVYWHPYAWEAAGTNLFIEETLSERYVGTGSRQNLSLKFKTAYDDSSIVYRAMMKEITGSDSATVRSAEVALTDVGEV